MTERSETPRIWMKKPGMDQPVEVEFVHDELVKLMVQGYVQVPAPEPLP